MRIEAKQKGLICHRSMGCPLGQEPRYCIGAACTAWKWETVPVGTITVLQVGPDPAMNSHPDGRKAAIANREAVIKRYADQGWKPHSDQSAALNDYGMVFERTKAREGHCVDLHTVVEVNP